jgi:hypothetical protein
VGEPFGFQRAVQSRRNILAQVPRSALAAFILAASSNPSSSATIEAEANRFVEVRLEGQIVPGDADRIATLAMPLKRQDAWELNWLHVSINSEGGSVSEALKIGRFLRSHNAFVGLRKDDQCLSSCVFVLMAGVMRDAYLGVGEVGVHRPFLFAADQDQDFNRTYHETRSELEAYVDEMRIPRSLLDLIYSVPPGEMRILSRDELELFFPFMDPVYEEHRVTTFAHGYGISNFEYRTREKYADEECGSHPLDNLNADDPIGTWENCRQAIFWNLTLEEYLVRKALSDKICLEGTLDRSALRVPRELNARDCSVYVMRHGV